MDFRPDPLQTLFLWSLIFNHQGEAIYRDVKPQIGPARGLTGAARRDELIGAGLVESEKVGRKLQVTLTDAGWAWAAANMDAPISTASTSAGAVLRAALTRFGRYLNGHQASLADLFVSEPDPNHQPSLADAICQAWQHDTGGRGGTPMRLTKLKQALADEPWTSVAETLLQMHRRGEVVLAPLENRREVEAADRATAISLAGEANHVFYMDRSK